MKKNFAIFAVVGILLCGLTASARPMGGPHHGGHGHPHKGMHPASLNHVMRPHMTHHHMHYMPTFRHRIGCPMYRGFGHKCTCYRYYGGSGIYIDFRLPIIF